MKVEGEVADVLPQGHACVSEPYVPAAPIGPGTCPTIDNRGAMRSWQVVDAQCGAAFCRAAWSTEAGSMYLNSEGRASGRSRMGCRHHRSRMASQDDACDGGVTLMLLSKTRTCQLCENLSRAMMSHVRACCVPIGTLNFLWKTGCTTLGAWLASAPSIVHTPCPRGMQYIPVGNPTAHHCPRGYSMALLAHPHVQVGP